MEWCGSCEMIKVFFSAFESTMYNIQFAHFPWPKERKKRQFTSLKIAIVWRKKRNRSANCRITTMYGKYFCTNKMRAYEYESKCRAKRPPNCSISLNELLKFSYQPTDERIARSSVFKKHNFTIYSAMNAGNVNDWVFCWRQFEFFVVAAVVVVVHITKNARSSPFDFIYKVSFIEP